MLSGRRLFRPGTIEPGTSLSVSVPRVSIVKHQGEIGINEVDVRTIPTQLEGHESCH